MASRHAAQPAYELKHRLAGAVILVGAAVLVIPWLLSAPGEATPVADAPLINESLIKQPKQPAARPALLNDDAATDTTATVATAATDTAVTDTPGWAVRVGTYARPAGAAAVTALLAANGFSVRRLAVTTTAGDAATRLWLGPYPDKKIADAVSAKLKPLTGQKGYVTRHTP